MKINEINNFILNKYQNGNIQLIENVNELNSFSRIYFIEDNILNTVKKFLLEFDFIDEYFNTKKLIQISPGSFTIVEISTLAEWYITRTIQFENVDLLAKIRDLSGLKQRKLTRITLLTGLIIQNEFKISDSIKILPISKLEIWQFQPIINSFHITDTSIKTYFSNYSVIFALVIESSTSPVFVENNFENKGNYSTENQVIDDFINSLYLYNNDGQCKIVADWYIPEMLSPCFGFLGGSIGLDNSEFKYYSDPFINGNQIAILEITEIFKNLNEANPDFKNKLRIPIERYRNSKTRRYLIDKSIELGIAYESIFLSDSRNSHSKSKKLKDRASEFLTEEGFDKNRIIKIINKMYDIRSDAVHEGKIKKENYLIEGKRMYVYEILSEAEMLFRIALKKLISKGFMPDWKHFDNPE